MATNKAEELVNAIEPPKSLSEQQINLARQFVKGRMMEGFAVQNFCSENGISTKTWYEWKENPDFNYYMNEVQGAIIPEDEKAAFQKIKKHILKIAEK